MVKEWKKKAKPYGSISKFVIENVENSINKEKGVDKKRGDHIKRIKDLETENTKLAKNNEILKIAFDRLDSELKSYRIKPFLDKDFQGMRKYDKKLLDTLRKRKFITFDEILPSLNIDPKNSEYIKGINKQLENLESYGLVEQTRKGWRWKG